MESTTNFTGKGTIVYLGAFRFPDKDAAAKRVLGIGYALREEGYRVVFAGGEIGLCETKYTQGFEYYSQNELDRSISGIYNKISNFFDAGNNTINWLSEFSKHTPINNIIVYNSSNVFVKKIFKFCKKNNIELIPDVTEWYKSAHLPGGKYGLVALDNSIKMNFTYPKFNKMIVISNYLKNHYKNSVKNIVVVPPLIFNKQIFLESPSIQTEYVNILYAGSPGRKDNLYKIVKLIQENQAQLKRLQLHIAGITQAQFEKVNFLKVTAQNINFKGRISPEEVMKLYREAQFSIIIRPKKRYANAGFPTKFVESLSAGVPVIATRTSDLDDFLMNGINGFLLESFDEKELKEILQTVVDLTAQQILTLKTNAKKTSTEFEFEQFKIKLSKLLI